MSLYRGIPSSIRRSKYGYSSVLPVYKFKLIEIAFLLSGNLLVDSCIFENPVCKVARYYLSINNRSFAGIGI